MLHKTCTLCMETKTIDDFYFVNKKTKPYKLTARCKKCTILLTSTKHKTKDGREKNKQAVKRWKDANKEKVKNFDLVRQYGITLDDYNKINEYQNYRCAICKKEAANSKRKDLYVDHCHVTMKVRGLLCQKCNQGLGLFDDNTEYLEQAISYLNRSKQNGCNQNQSQHHVGADESCQ